MTIAWLLILLLFIVGINVPKFHTEEHTVTVVKTEIDKKDNYLIFCEENGQSVTYTLNDSFWYWQWNTSDLYGQIKSGQTWKFKTSGVRFSIFSWYPNIIEMKKVSDSE